MNFLHFTGTGKKNDAPIAVFDSGVGGISVLRALIAEMPGEHYWYYGDSANAPYGTKCSEEVRELTTVHVDRFKIGRASCRERVFITV